MTLLIIATTIKKLPLTACPTTPPTPLTPSSREATEMEMEMATVTATTIVEWPRENHRPTVMGLLDPRAEDEERGELAMIFRVALSMAAICGSLSLRLTASVLSLRGDDLTSQPFVSPDERYLFAWNGQVYSINEGENDGRILFDWFCDAAHEKGVEAALQEVFASSALQDAEWAMVLVDTHTGSVYFGRDALGRRSLLVSQKDGELVLASVASPEAIDVSLAFKELGHLTTLMPRNAERLLLCPTDTFADPTDSERQAALDSIQAALLESVRRRVTTVQGVTAQEKAPPIAILFSGGLDCTILAYLAHQVVPESQGIDLINVAFENPRVLAAGKKAGSNSSSPSASSSFDTPDRLLSRRSLAQLQSLAPDRLWNLVEIDVHYSSYLAHKPTILSIMHPSESVMDLSLASVLYFASKGSEHSIGPRVYISGLGADELFGGYSRHRGAFASGGWARAVDELQMDLDRLPTRNLGRDDRAVSSHGREARYPFLAAPVLQLAARLPVRVKAEWGRGEGVGDKLLLRMLARERLGLGEVGREKKRAMQFGARSAKMERGRHSR
ncbi:hypothetical protein BDZ90DRAFT_245491 [Jaminaea rosea]|uniref:Glutamine amidotransferase type-2 domain-containing protein n=1 Tax=Jaminaea rosea TaxID=1569628 RepID=A0A316UTW8_9BASI|nr:hypothetical protein BDZ90DRAFT_245491 [Jaminaea rosea]PWN28712.1 hypothetical protein BDZ90DRAFT_245491 [Jaminaea rosea]